MENYFVYDEEVEEEEEDTEMMVVEEDTEMMVVEVRRKTLYGHCVNED